MTHPRISSIGVLALALLLFPATAASARTFGDWAAAQGWPAGHATPATVYAQSAVIDSLTGMGNYNWTGTPTTTLSFYNNQIAAIESGSLSGLSGLTSLRLDANRITSVDSGDLAGLDSLISLNLSCNRIASIESGDFSGLVALKSLDLTWNNITSIESGAFSGLGNLAELYLVQNRYLATLNLEGANLSSLSAFDANGSGVTRVSLRDATLSQKSWQTLLDELADLGGVVELDISGVDFAGINLTWLVKLHDLTDLWLVDVRNMGAMSLDAVLNCHETTTLHMTPFDYDAFNAAGGGLLAAWDAEPGHEVRSLVPGDANGDSVVDEADAAILAAHWGATDAHWFDGDLNNDGRVDAADASILAANWGHGLNEATAVPEPATFSLLAIAAACLLALRRQR